MVAAVNEDDKKQIKQLERSLLKDPNHTIEWISESLRAGWKTRHHFPVGSRWRIKDHKQIRLWVTLIRWVKENSA